MVPENSHAAVTNNARDSQPEKLLFACVLNLPSSLILSFERGTVLTPPNPTSCRNPRMRRLQLAALRYFGVVSESVAVGDDFLVAPSALNDRA